jgi:hypothetical protein
MRKTEIMEITGKSRYYIEKIARKYPKLILKKDSYGYDYDPRILYIIEEESEDLRKKKAKIYRHHTTTYLNDYQIKMINRYMKAKGINRSEALREAIQFFYENREKKT